MLDFKDFIVADYRPGEPDILKYRAQRRRHIGEDVEQTDEALTTQQRLQRKRQMRKYKHKIEIGQMRAKRRFANTKTLEKRAQRQARMKIYKKLTKDVPKDELTYARRKEIEARLDKPAFKARIKMIARKMLPQVRKQEIERKRAQGVSNDK
jgi:hypothetical protein